MQQDDECDFFVLVLPILVIIQFCCSVNGVVIDFLKQWELTVFFELKL